METNSIREALFSTKEVVDYARCVVEVALRESFGHLRMPLLSIEEYAGKLSTYSQRVSPDINAQSLQGWCGGFSRALKEDLLSLGFQTEFSGATYDLQSVEHIYLTTNINGVKIIIDPTIGQYINGYNHVFVGTREQLQEIVINQTQEDGPYRILQQKRTETASEFFDRIWGQTSYELTREAIHKKRQHSA